MRTWVINGTLKIRATDWKMARFHARMRRINVESICLYTTPAAARRQRRQAIAVFNQQAALTACMGKRLPTGGVLPAGRGGLNDYLLEKPRCPRNI